MIAAACQDPDVLRHLGGTLGTSARAQAAALATSKRERARAMAVARAPIPAGFRAIHPTWIEAALAELPARARDDLASGGMRGTVIDPTGVWLARWATAGLIAMETDHAIERPRSIDEAAKLGADKLVAWLEDVGADQLAFALGAANAATAARIVGPKLVGRDTTKALGPRRAAIERSTIEMTGDALLLVGARTISPYTDALVRRRLALRLPRTRGLAVLFELRAWAKRSIDTTPTWDALAAP